MILYSDIDYGHVDLSYYHNIDDNEVNSVYTDAQGSIYVMSKKKGILIGKPTETGESLSFQLYYPVNNGYPLDNGIFSSSPHSSYVIPGDEIQDFYVDSQGRMYGASLYSTYLEPNRPQHYQLWVGEKNVQGNYQFKIISDSIGNFINRDLFSNVFADEKGTVYPTTLWGKLSIAEKQPDGTYQFSDAYIKFSDGSIDQDTMTSSVYADREGTVYLGIWEPGGHFALAIGTKQANSNYQFVRYDFPYRITEIYASPKGETIYVATFEGGIIIGTKQADGSYQFTTYGKSSGLEGDLSMVVDDDQGTIYVDGKRGSASSL